METTELSQVSEAIMEMANATEAKPSEQAKPNRAARRRLAKYLRHATAPLRRRQRLMASMILCGRCGKLFAIPRGSQLVGAVRSALRCQCKAEKAKKPLRDQ